jgi:hypothetical protein
MHAAWADHSLGYQSYNGPQPMPDTTENLLKAGYLENWSYRPTLSGTPQGGIVSPLLANI